MNKNNSGIIFDRDFSNALIKIASKDGYVKFNVNNDSDMNLVKSLKSSRSYSLLQQKCLELALLYDEVYLNDPCEIAVLDKLKKAGIVKQYRYLDKDQEDDSTNEISLAQDIKPLVINYITKHFKKGRPYLKDIRGLANKYVDGLYDFEVLWRAGFHEEAIRNTHIPLKNILKIEGDSVEFIYSLLDESQESDNMHGFVVDMIDIDFEIDSIISMMKMSKEFKVPFISKRIVDFENKIEIDKSYEAYKTCMIEMSREVQYAPRIDSIDDLLRLRESSEIRRFREVLNEWTNLISSQQFNLAEKIRKDILKANKEISKLNKWKKVDKFIYYLSIPTMFIPYLSNIATIGGAYTRYHIEGKEKKYGWIGIGR